MSHRFWISCRSLKLRWVSWVWLPRLLVLAFIWSDKEQDKCALLSNMSMNGCQLIITRMSWLFTVHLINRLTDPPCFFPPQRLPWCVLAGICQIPQQLYLKSRNYFWKSVCNTYKHRTSWKAAHFQHQLFLHLREWVSKCLAARTAALVKPSSKLVHSLALSLVWRLLVQCT